MRHHSARARACPNHKADIKEKVIQELGPNPGRYVIVVLLESIVRKAHCERFRTGVIRLSQAVRTKPLVGLSLHTLRQAFADSFYEISVNFLQVAAVA